MIDRDREMFGYGVDAFCDLVASTPADDPPGAIAAAAVAVGVAAALAEKCGEGEVRSSLESLRTEAFSLAARDAGAYREWRRGETDSPAVETYPLRLAALGAELANIIAEIPPHPVVGDTDLRAARELVRGAVRAAEAVAAGNLGERR